jgi:hypothetical protein
VLTTADLSGADLAELRAWNTLASASYLIIESVRHAPAGFVEWVTERGAAVETPTLEEFETGRRFSQEWRSA